ncbi:hypothetical protein [Variovorax sp. 38R]|uniref:hypothetical protein n=1 Tax=Variovorax sp. 38R TaxID=2774875 RepID=UPI000F90B344|nr:hypothetical protein [Variovorax sp. 38R]QOF77547.1 hypothetical protein IG196_24870 [Variovorax sp. 38R]
MRDSPRVLHLRTACVRQLKFKGVGCEKKFPVDLLSFTFKHGVDAIDGPCSGPSGSRPSGLTGGDFKRISYVLGFWKEAGMLVPDMDRTSIVRLRMKGGACCQAAAKVDSS